MMPVKDPGAANLVVFKEVRARPEPLDAVAYNSHVLPSSRSSLYFVIPAAGEASSVMVLKNTLVSIKGVAPLLNQISGLVLPQSMTSKSRSKLKV